MATSSSSSNENSTLSSIWEHSVRMHPPTLHLPRHKVPHRPSGRLHLTVLRRNRPTAGNSTPLWYEFLTWLFWGFLIDVWLNDYDWTPRYSSTTSLDPPSPSPPPSVAVTGSGGGYRHHPPPPPPPPPAQPPPPALRIHICGTSLSTDPSAFANPPARMQPESLPPRRLSIRSADDKENTINTVSCIQHWSNALWDSFEIHLKMTWWIK